jgi:hypothetical protein
MYSLSFVRSDIAKARNGNPNAREQLYDERFAQRLPFMLVLGNVVSMTTARSSKSHQSLVALLLLGATCERHIKWLPSTTVQVCAIAFPFCFIVFTRDRFPLHSFHLPEFLRFFILSSSPGAMMFIKSSATLVLVLALGRSVSAHAGVQPALGVQGGDIARKDVQRPSNNAPCGKTNIAQTIDSSTAVTAVNGVFKVTAVNFNG